MVTPGPTYDELEAAVAKGDKSKALDILNDPGFDVHSRHSITGCTPLHLAATGGFMKLAEAALEKNICVNVRDTMASFTPLHMACMQGRKKIVKLLISHGADPTVKTKMIAPMGIGGLTPLELMRRSNIFSKSIQKLLVVDVAAKTTSSASLCCVFCGIEEGGKDCVRLSKCQCDLPFCSKRCQRKAWPGHRNECKRIVKAKETNDGPRTVVGKDGGLRFDWGVENQSDRVQSMSQLGISLADQRLFMHISPLTEGQSRIQLFGSQEKYLEHRRDWEERALSEEVCDPMQHIFRCLAEQGTGSDAFWDQMTTPNILSCVSHIKRV